MKDPLKFDNSFCWTPLSMENKKRAVCIGIGHGYGDTFYQNSMANPNQESSVVYGITSASNNKKYNLLRKMRFQPGCLHISAMS